MSYVLIIYCMAYVYQGHFTYDLEFTNSRCAVPSLHGYQCFERVNSDTAFERHGSRIPINDLNTVPAIKKHLIQFLGLTELTIKYGLGDFDIRLYRIAPKPRGKSDNFANTTDGQCWSSTQEVKWTVCILGACVFVSCDGV